MDKKYTELKNVESLNTGDFGGLITELLTAIKNVKINYVDASAIWNNIYKDIFNRSYVYDDEAIVSIHEQYLNLIELRKNELVKYNEVLVFKNLDQLEFHIVSTFAGKDIDLKNLEFKFNNKNTTFKRLGGEKLINEEAKGIQTWQATFKNGFDGDAATYILITYKAKFIKSKDQIILKNIEKIEVY